MDRTITAVADRFGVSSDTLRYYERRGLLVPAGRSPAGYRLYDDAAVQRLGFIRTAQRMGLQLGDIKELLEIRDQGGCPCGHTDEVVARRLAEVATKLDELASLQRELLALRDRNDACLEGRAREWSCAVGLTEGGEDR
jgi:DNA-binding transcriptional MerR regulator